MNQPAEALGLGISHATSIVMSYTEDLKGDEWVHRPCATANCAAWTLGHLIIAARGMMTRAGATDLPSLPEGFEKRFGRGEDAPKASEFGDTSILRPLFKETHDRFAAVARGLSPEQLDKEINPDHPFFRTVGTMLAFAPVHIGTHAGQITIIRRSLGRPPLR
jgi:hypothetical protein